VLTEAQGYIYILNLMFVISETVNKAVEKGMVLSAGTRTGKLIKFRASAGALYI
jgi:hypothetical protein